MSRLVTLVLLSAMPAVCLAGVPVSPGQPETPRPLTESCPTFSWAPEQDAVSQRLVVFALADGQSYTDLASFDAIDTARSIIDVDLPIGAASWSPSADRCLTRGTRYAWVVGSVDETGAGSWSAPLFFSLTEAPSEREIAAALEVLREAQARGLLSDAEGVGPEASPEPSFEVESEPLAASDDRLVLPVGTKERDGPLDAVSAVEATANGEAVPEGQTGTLQVDGSFQSISGAYDISMAASETEGLAQIVVTSPAGFGMGETVMRTDGLSVGEDPGGPGAFMLKVVHSSFGFNLQRGTSNNDWELLTSSASEGDLILFGSGAFRGSFSGTDGSYSPSSDLRLKRNVRPLEGVLARVLELQPSRYEFIDNNPSQEESIGFLAQEVLLLFPELVHIVEDERSLGMHALNYGGFSVLAIRAIQEQQKIIEELRREVERLQ